MLAIYVKRPSCYQDCSWLFFPQKSQSLAMLPVYSFWLSFSPHIYTSPHLLSPSLLHPLCSLSSFTPGIPINFCIGNSAYVSLCSVSKGFVFHLQRSLVKDFRAFSNCNGIITFLPCCDSLKENI